MIETGEEIQTKKVHNICLPTNFGSTDTFVVAKNARTSKQEQHYKTKIRKTYGTILLLSIVFNSYVAAVTGAGAASTAAAAAATSAAVCSATFSSKFFMSASGIGEAENVS